MRFHRPRRIVLLSAIAASLGLITTLAFAWGPGAMGGYRGYWSRGHDQRVALVDGRNQTSPAFDGYHSSAWSIDAWTLYPAWRLREVDPTLTRIHLPGYAQRPNEGPWPRAGLLALEVDNTWESRQRPHVISVTTVATGWPLRTMAYEVWSIDERPMSAALHMQEYTTHAWTLRDGRQDGVFLPLRPIWTGLIANTVVFGAAWMGLFVGLGALRRRRRVARRLRRGLCRHCAYDLRGLAAGSPCPECGAHAQRQTAAPLGAAA